MAQYNYWRLKFYNSQGGIYIQLTEVAFLNIAGLELSVGGTPSASSNYSASYSAANAFDKNNSTDWCTSGYRWPQWLQYTFTAPVDVARITIKCSSFDNWLPQNAADLALEYSPDGAQWYPSNTKPVVVSGQFKAGEAVVLELFDISVVTPKIVGPAGRSLQDWRVPADTAGTITANNRVLVKPDASAPEIPFAGARVRLHHLVTGRLDWQGLSDDQGYYWPERLEVGAWYYPVAIDLTGTHECDAAGPVQAVRAT